MFWILIVMLITWRHDLPKPIEVGVFVAYKLYLNEVDFKKSIRIYLGNSYPFISREPYVRKPICVHPWDHTNPISPRILDCSGGENLIFNRCWKQYRQNLSLLSVDLRVVKGTEKSKNKPQKYPLADMMENYTCLKINF